MLNGPEQALAHLEAQVADLRLSGGQPTQAMQDRVEEQKKLVKENNAAIALHAKERAERKLADEAASQERAEAALREEARATWAGPQAEFEHAWVTGGYRAKYIEAKSLGRIGAEQTDERIRRKAAEGYRGAF